MLHNRTTLRKKLHPLLWLLALSPLAGQAQDAQGYQTPPKALADLVTAPLTPTVRMASRSDMMLILEQAAAPSIAELSQPELKLAGLRMNPANNGPSRVQYITGLKLKKLTDKDSKTISGLPANPLISFVQWSPDDSKVAFANSTDNRMDLYVADVATASAQKIGSIALNGTLGMPYRWLSDSKGLIVKAIPANRGAAPEVSRVP